MTKQKLSGAITESPVNSTARILSKALAKIGPRSNIPADFCEKLSVFLNQSYSTRNRAFHNISHAHDVSGVTSGSATAQLAALFHDVVYFQLDWAKTTKITDLFAPFEVSETHKLIVPKVKNDNWASALIALFGFHEGEEILSFAGLNEFLSAWVAIQKLQDHVSTVNLLKIAACIQTTIPLWIAKTKPSDVPIPLHRNIKVAAKILKLRLSSSFFNEAVSEAIEMANLDVISFAYENPRNFLYNSWALVGESNPALQGSLFTVSQYKDAIAKMEEFFANLKPNAIFREFNGTPKPLEMKRLCNRAGKNLEIGSLYILLRLIDTCLIDSIAQLTGGDAPLEMFIGPKATRRERTPQTLDLFLNYKIPKHKDSEKSAVVLSLLSEKSAFRSAFDSKGAPLAAFLYERMTKLECDHVVKGVRKYVGKEISPSDYLSYLRPELVFTVINAISEIAFTRKESLKDLAADFKLLKKKSA